MTKLTSETILVPSSRCVVRSQEEGKLFYNPQSDELHLVPPTGFTAYQLCDSLNTVDQIHRILSQSMGVDESVLREPLYEFLGKMVDRGILEVEAHA